MRSAIVPVILCSSHSRPPLASHADKQQSSTTSTPKASHQAIRNPGADYSNIKAGENCDVFHNGGGPQDIPILGFQQNQYRDVLIGGAQRFMCPDTLH